MIITSTNKPSEGASLAPIAAQTTADRRTSFSDLTVRPVLRPQRSATSFIEQRVCEKSDSDASDWAVAEDVSKKRAVFKAKPRGATSLDLGTSARFQWSQNIYENPDYQGALRELKRSADEYQQQAQHDNWKDVLLVQADRSELIQLAEEASKLTTLDSNVSSRYSDGLSKFGTVALEYSKMLEVVVQQSPEYANLAWGIVRLLLVGYTSHKKLKNLIEQRIISFGESLGFINEVMLRMPSPKMVAAITEMYTAFKIFLAKAVKYFKESKALRVVKAFTFPEIRFEQHCQRIDKSLNRIHEVAKVGHTRIAVETLRQVSAIRGDIDEGNSNVRDGLKSDIKASLETLFEKFDQAWIKRFEQILKEAAARTQSRGGTPKPTSQDTLSPETAKGLLQGTNRAALPPSSPGLFPVARSPQPGSHLYDFVLEPKKFHKFQEKSFPDVSELEHGNAAMNFRLRQLSNLDLQQVAGLLRHREIQLLVAQMTSQLLWVNVFRLPGPSDWATACTVRLIDKFTISKAVTLHHFCGNYAKTDEMSSPCVLLQNLIMQFIQSHTKAFSVRQQDALALSQFKEAEKDIDKLWDLFRTLLESIAPPCVMIIIDHLDNLHDGPDYDLLLERLLDLATSETLVFKIFITSRVGGTPKQILQAIDDLPLQENEDDEPKIRTFTVPRSPSSVSAGYMSLERRMTRIGSMPITPSTVAQPITDEDIHHLLHSSSEDEDFNRQLKPGNSARSTTSRNSSTQRSLLDSMTDEEFAGTDGDEFEFKTRTYLEDDEDSEFDDVRSFQGARSNYEWDTDDSQIFAKTRGAKPKSEDSEDDLVQPRPSPPSKIPFGTLSWNPEQHDHSDGASTDPNPDYNDARPHVKQTAQQPSKYVEDEFNSDSDDIFLQSKSVNPPSITRHELDKIPAKIPTKSPKGDPHRPSMKHKRKSSEQQRRTTIQFDEDDSDANGHGHEDNRRTRPSPTTGQTSQSWSSSTAIKPTHQRRRSDRPSLAVNDVVQQQYNVDSDGDLADRE